VLRILFWIPIALALGDLLRLALINGAHLVFVLAAASGLVFSIYRCYRAAVERLRIPERARFQRAGSPTSELVRRRHRDEPDEHEPPGDNDEPPERPAARL
jgi:hypothetical protein